MRKRRANGEGSIYQTIKRNKRQVFLKEECAICKSCNDRTACNNRIGYDKCLKCKECKDCLKYCDRFYCYKTVEAQVRHKSIARGSNSKEANKKKIEKEATLNTRENMKNKKLSLIDTMKFNEEEKLKYGLIGENTYLRNMNTISAIQKHPSSIKLMEKLTEDDIKDILSYFVETKASQSQIKKVYNEMKSACKISHAEYLFEDIKSNTFVSDVEKKDVIAFSLQEEQQLLDYINNHEDKLILSSLSDIEPKTIKNLIKFSLATGMRIGETCSLNYNSNIDMQNKRIIVSNTLTRNKNGKTIQGSQTKTGRKTKRAGKKDERYVPFNVLFNENDFIAILDEQCKISKNNCKNSLSLLFCTKEGQFISHSSFNTIFKRICRQAGIKLDLISGCHVHMMKHTAVSRMVEKGINIYAISAIVGTTVEILHKTYAHILDDFIQNEIEKSKLIKNETDLKLNNINVSKNNIIQIKSFFMK